MARAEKFVPLEKRSKKEQKAYHAQQRGSWNGVNPVTRVVPNKKGYDRKRAKPGGMILTFARFSIRWSHFLLRSAG